MRAILFFIQLLLWLLIIRIVLRGLVRMFGLGAARPRPTTPPSSTPPRAIEDLVFDRICRTYVPRSRAVAGLVDGRDELFCSERCRDEARSSVARAS
jgi:hypothetical protein